MQSRNCSSPARISIPHCNKVLSAALLMLAAPAASQPYPATEVLDAFRTACANTRKFEKLEKQLPKKGWEALPAGGEPRIAQLVSKGRAALEDGERLDGHEYRKSVAGRQLYLVTSRVTDESGIWASGCRLYDFDAGAPIADATLVKWMTREPTHKEELPNGGVIRKWEPGWRSGVSVDVDFAGHGGEFNEKFGLSGVVMIASSIGGF